VCPNGADSKYAFDEATTNICSWMKDIVLFCPISLIFKLVHFLSSFFVCHHCFYVPPIDSLWVDCVQKKTIHNIMSDTTKSLKQRPAADDDYDIDNEDNNDDQMSKQPELEEGNDEDAVAVQVAAVLGLDTEATINYDGRDDKDIDDNDGTIQVAADVVMGNDQGDESVDEDDSDEEVEAVASVVEEDDDNDGDEAVVDAEDAGDDHVISAEQPTVVVAMEDVDDGGDDDDIPEVEAVAIVEEELPRPEPASSSTKPKQTPKKAASVSSSKSPKRNTATKANSVTSNAAITKRKKPKSAASKVGENAWLLPKIDSKRMEAANTAREMLYEAVPRLPFPVNESSNDQYYVRNFGRLKVDSDETSSKFSTSTALYPVGFSCDRYEFSPSHGRILKLRCSIIDGKVVGETGPIFRVMWGQGVDDDVDTVEYPYDPFTNSAPITSKTGDDDVVVVPSVPAMHHSIDQQVLPAVGMRVKARFDKNQYFHGTISKVVEREEGSNSANSKKKKKKAIHVTILYDDGSNEETTFPDPDITLVMPGTEIFAQILA
jgi:hypothetical protein